MEGLIVEHAEGVLELRLDRPDKMNAVTPGMVAALRSAIDAAAVDAAVRCVLLTAAGRAFCAGRDLSGASGGEDAERILAREMNPVVAALFALPKPTVAAVNGAAMGFGLGLALACDVVYAGASARFGVPFARLGAALDSGGHWLLPRRLPPGRVLEMIFSAEPVDGATAERIGLAERCLPDESLREQARRFAQRCADGPAHAFARQKALLRSAPTLGLDEVLAAEARLQGELAQTADYREGIEAFQQRRAPVFRRSHAGA
ncbi:MAG: enoyl-CoA hydratase/isomerase family protein [Burkholderiaceae bacterium]